MSNNGHKAEARWRYGMLVASHRHDLSLDVPGSTHRPEEENGDCSAPLVDRLAFTTSDEELARFDLEELIQQTRQELVRVLQQKDSVKGRSRRLNIALHLAVFDSWYDGLTKTEVAKHHGVSETYICRVAKQLLDLDVVKQFVERIRQQKTS